MSRPVRAKRERSIEADATPSAADTTTSRRARCAGGPLSIAVDAAEEVISISSSEEEEPQEQHQRAEEAVPLPTTSTTAEAIPVADADNDDASNNGDAAAASTEAAVAEDNRALRRVLWSVGHRAFATNNRRRRTDEAATDASDQKALETDCAVFGLRPKNRRDSEDAIQPVTTDGEGDVSSSLVARAGLCRVFATCPLTLLNQLSPSPTAAGEGAAGAAATGADSGADEAEALFRLMATYFPQAMHAIL